MFKRILIATDGSDLSQRAVLGGIALAHHLGAQVVGLSVIPPFHTVTLDATMLENTAASFEHAARSQADNFLASVAEAARDAGVDCSTTAISADEPWQAIIDTAEARQCDLVVMASHGRKGIKGALLGSETQKVLVHSKIPVLVYR